MGESMIGVTHGLMAFPLQLTWALPNVPHSVGFAGGLWAAFSGVH